MAETPDFDLHVAKDQDGPRVQISGELDAYTSPRLRALANELLGEPFFKLVFDLSNTTFVDSTALGVLVAIARKAREHGSELVLDSPCAPVYRVLETTGVAAAVPIRNAPSPSRDDRP